jgi:hypothetical protein
MNQPNENLPGMEETLPEDIEHGAELEDADVVNANTDHCVDKRHT